MAGLREEKEAWLTEEGGNLTLFKKSNPANGPKVTAVTHLVNYMKEWMISFTSILQSVRHFSPKFIQHCLICRPSYYILCRKMPDWNLNPGQFEFA
jgi:hypothetical protein